jgi:enoyl-CoA hydratase
MVSINVPEFRVIDLDISGPVARLTLNRPEKLNAYNIQMAYEVRQACDIVEQSEHCRVMIVRGAGRAFCAGNDLTPGGDVPANRRVSDDVHVPPAVRNMDSNYNTNQYFRYVVDSWRRFWEMPKPTIAQIHGYCLAGGISIAMQCDLVVAASNCQIGQPELRGQGTANDMAMWPFTVGLRRAKELLFTGYTVSGETAAEWGMINYSFPADQLEERVETMAATIANMRPELLHYYKSMVNRVGDRMGVRDMIEVGSDMNAMVSAIGQRGFREVSNEQGLKTALAWRDEPFGGQRMPDEWLHGRVSQSNEPQPR